MLKSVFKRNIVLGCSIKLIIYNFRLLLSITSYKNVKDTTPYQTFCWWKFYSYHRMLNDMAALQDIALLMIKSTLYFTYNISLCFSSGASGKITRMVWEAKKLY